jgi:hypothetical protein
MTKQEIHEHLNEMLSNQKTKNFLGHLIKSYYPYKNVDKVWDKPKDKIKCVITKEELVSVQEIKDGMQTEEFKTNLMESLKTMFDENRDKTTPIQKLLDGKILGFTGKDTTTYMSLQACEEFHAWILTKVLNGDKEVIWYTNSGNKKPKPKEEPKTSSAFTLGELDSFKKLYEKFK